ncbi:hypothetical protein [Nonomuraea basaltis]|uniref:hypothetical protein n=1 Tax=Nonomuraea basaltis TaxID=2495887 RepID=UPI00110C4323|nr:hypothetical protein [Nonomuraea basaltis]TMR88297.1 hypothetical protein EJK15_67045 [Nonomuraea basaltis]
MFRPTTLFASAILAATLGALPLAATAANAQTTAQSTAHSTAQTTAQTMTAHSTAQQSAAPCRKIQITGRNVAIRDFPFVNGLVLRTVRTGTILTTCERTRLAGSSYPSKCGLRGDVWYKVRSGRVSITGSPFGFVPVTCARAL